MKILAGDTLAVAWIDLKRRWKEEGHDILVVEFPVRVWNAAEQKSNELWCSYLFFKDLSLLQAIFLKNLHRGWRKALPWAGYHVLFVKQDASDCLDILEELCPEANFFDCADTDAAELPVAVNGE